MHRCAETGIVKGAGLINDLHSPAEGMTFQISCIILAINHLSSDQSGAIICSSRRLAAQLKQVVEVVS